MKEGEKMASTVEKKKKEGRQPTGHWEVRELEVLGNTPCKWFSRLVWTAASEKRAMSFPLERRRFVPGVSLRAAMRMARLGKTASCAEEKKLEKRAVDMKRLEKLAKFDGDFKLLLDLVRSCKKQKNSF